MGEIRCGVWFLGTAGDKKSGSKRGGPGTKEAGTAYPPNPHYSCLHAHEEYIKTHKPPERRLITKFVYHAALRVSALGAYSPWKAPLDSKQGHSTQPTAAPSPAPPSASPAPAPATCQWHRAIFRAAPRSPSPSYLPSSLHAPSTAISAVWRENWTPNGPDRLL